MPARASSDGLPATAPADGARRDDEIDTGEYGPVGRSRFAPARDRGGPVLVFAHGAGTDRNHVLVAGFAARVAGLGVPVVTFDFAYSTAGRRAPDRPPKLDAVCAAVLRVTAADHPGRRLALGGRSMGARVAGRVAVRPDLGLPLAALALVSYPLHRPAKAGSPPPAPLRTDWWPEAAIPALFVQGDRDRLCDLDLLERERPALAGGSTVHRIAGADHGLDVRKSSGRTRDDVLDEAARAVAGFLLGPEGERPA